VRGEQFARRAETLALRGERVRLGAPPGELEGVARGRHRERTATGAARCPIWPISQLERPLPLSPVCAIREKALESSK
jgi:hypothetical protein